MLDKTTWILLLHQLPAKPSYFRAKIWRRLQQIGAVAIKQAAYVMPYTRHNQEAFEWIAKEIMESGGEAVLAECTFQAGLNDEQIIELFRSARRADYQKLLQEAQDVMGLWNDSEKLGAIHLECKSSLTKLRSTFSALKEIDFYPDREQAQVEAYLVDMETIFLRDPSQHAQTLPKEGNGSFLNKTWVTRSNVYVDRIASAWFIRRFIDNNAILKFINSSHYTPEKYEIRFDMMEGEFTHQKDLCTFETLVQIFAGEDTALQQLAKVIHDIDLKDEAFAMAETPGVKALFDGIVTVESGDIERIEKASVMLDQLLVYFRTRT